MSKVVCDVCGTSYPEMATQCPICGFACASSQQGEDKSEAGSGYTYVKGGRFSKSNVRKKNGYTGSAGRGNGRNKRTARKKNQDSNRGLIITAAVLALAIVIVVAYIIIRFFVIPDNEANNTNPSVTVQDNGNEVPCTGVVLSKESVTLKERNAKESIEITVEPADCTDQEIAIDVDDVYKSVVDVSLNGKTVTITAVGPGNAIINVMCGDQSCSISVNCEFAEELTLTRDYVELTYAGQEVAIYPDNIRRDEISWSVEDRNVATVSNGVIVAVGEGESDTTKVTAEYKGQKVVCTVKCSFKVEDEENTSGSDQNNNQTDNYDPVINGTGGGVSE